MLLLILLAKCEAVIAVDADAPIVMQTARGQDSIGSR